MTEPPRQTGFFSARPTLRVNGQIAADLGERWLVSLMVEETTLGLFRCEARFQNWGPKGAGADSFLFFDRQILDFGQPFAVELGAPGNTSPVFAGRITGIEAHYPAQRAPELTVLAEDRFQDLRMERRTRSFEQISDADLFRRIASDHSLAAEIDVDGPTHRVVAQLNQSDLAFLRERAAAIDAELWVDHRTLYAQQRTRRSAGSVTLTYGQNLLECSVLADLAHQRTAVRVCGWDVAAKQAIDEEATDNVISGELAGGRSGSAVLGQALAERRERIVSAVPLSQNEARSMAEARYRERARRFVRATGTVNGEVRLRVGATVKLQELGPLFEGNYYVTRARHLFDLTYGYRTEFDAERPAIGG